MNQFRLQIVTVLGLIFLLILGVATSSHAQGKVRINAFEIDVKGKDPPIPQELQPLEGGMYKKWIVQFAGPIHENEKIALTNLGADIGDYLPEFAFIVTMDNVTQKKVENLSFIKGVVRYKPAYKIAKNLKSENGTVRTDKKKNVKLHIRVDYPKNHGLVLAQLKKGRVLEIRGDVLKVEADSSEIAGLAQVEEVVWIEEAVDLNLQNDTTSWVIQTNQVGNTSIWDKGLHGEGQIVGVGDSGLDYDMPWFRDPSDVDIGDNHRKIQGYDITYGDDYDADNPGHGTHVAGTLGGDRLSMGGLSSDNGIAPKCRLFIQDLSPGATRAVYPPLDLGLLFVKAYEAGARIHTNSWGGGVNSYSTLAATADRFLWEHKDFLALFANGNAGPSLNTVINPATAKNVISVGATLNGSGAENVASFSSNGLTSDGRIKPTVCAPGDGASEGAGIISADSDGIKNSYNSGTIAMRGTSMATPAVAGAAALVRQYFKEGYYPTGTVNAADAFIPSAALIRSLIINSAQNMIGIYGGGSIPGTGQGWGRVNLSSALKFKENPQVLVAVDESTGLLTGEARSRKIFSAAGLPLKVTLVWTDYPGAEEAGTALVNDLDLIVTGPDGTVYLGNVFSNGLSVPGGRPDRLNVEEQVLINTPLEGSYDIRIDSYNVPYGPQPFALVVTGASGVTSMGVISLDKGKYNAAGTLAIRVFDRDLNKDADLQDDVQVVVTSTTEPTGEVIRLLEIGPDTGIFAGTLPLRPGAPTAGNGYLEIAGGDTVTAVYEDANDGSGNPAVVSGTALIDLTPPTISEVKVASVGEMGATITWTTNEPADSVLDYGGTASGGFLISDPRLTKDHQLSIFPLQEDATYFFSVAATDEAGNHARDDNGGTLYSFTTRSVPPRLTVYSSYGVKTYSDFTDIYGTAEDSSGVASITVNGKPASFMPSGSNYGLQDQPKLGSMSYELRVPLDYGDNTISVVATDSLGNAKEDAITVTRYQLPAAGSDYTITATTSPGGSISPAGSVPVVAGGSQLFTFTPNPGYKVAYVTVGAVNKGAISSYTFTNIQSDQTISVYFTPITYKITVTAGANGSISPGTSSYIGWGATQTYTITPKAGYHVETLTVDGAPVTPATSYTFTNVTADHTIAATFAANPTYTITASATGSGTITPSGATPILGGQNQTYTIAPAGGQRIDKVLVDGVNMGAVTSYTFGNVQANHSIEAYFVVNSYTVTATANGANGGTITNSVDASVITSTGSGSVLVPAGQNITYTFTPNPGYKVAYVTVGAVNKGAISSYTFTNIQSDQTISVAFTPITSTITVTAGANGSISPGTSGYIGWGATQKYTITPKAGYHVETLTVDGAPVTPATSYTFTNVTADHTIAATFAANPTYTITASVTGSGTITPSGATPILGGQNQTYTIAPAAGQRIDKVLVDGVNKGAVTSYTFGNVQANHSIEAYFVANGYTITASAIGSGTITPSGDSTVAAGGSQSYTFTPNPGYKIAYVMVSGANKGAISSYTFTNVQANKTISVYFTPIKYKITVTAGANGSISPGTSSYIGWGATQKYTITPKAGYHVETLTVDGAPVTPATSYTFTNVTADHTIAATFAAN